MAGSVQDVDAEALVLELEDGGSDGDTTLFFNFHPVRHGGTGVLFALDHAGLVDGSAVEQELFRQSSLAGVRMGDDGKRAPAVDFGSVFRHWISSKQIKNKILAGEPGEHQPNPAGRWGSVWI